MTHEFIPDLKVRNLYIRWIEQFDQRYAKAWAHRYIDNCEAAMCEATFWGVLQDCNVDVEPCESLTGEESFPDFKCHKNGEAFYVEVTCLQIESVTNKTSLSHEAKDGRRFSQASKGFWIRRGAVACIWNTHWRIRVRVTAYLWLPAS